MNEQAQTELDRILSLDPSSRTENDLAFLAARSEYHDEKPAKAEKPEKPAKESK